MTLDNLYRRPNSNGKKEKNRSQSESKTVERRKFDSYYFQHPDSNQNMLLPDKIKEWMLNTEPELGGGKPEYFKNASENSGTSEHSYQSKHGKSNSDCGELSDQELFGIKESEIPDILLMELNKSYSTLADVKWDVKNCDLLIEVEDTLFPIEKNFVSYVSDSFRYLIEECADIQNENSFILKLNGYNLNEITTVLDFIYSVNVEPVSDENVASLLQLGEEFKVERLRFQCEKHLANSDTFNPLIMSHLARQYGLDSLLERSYSEMSKIEDIEDTQEFQLLDSVAQNKILKYILRRYKRASRTLSQFDVHLCNHHGNDPKSNQCCFRAATYSTENDRTFLVQMENPEEKLIQLYDEAFNCDSKTLLQDR